MLSTIDLLKDLNSYYTQSIKSLVAMRPNGTKVNAHLQLPQFLIGAVL